MNLTLAVDEQVVERAREIARQQGTSLNALIREYIERLAGQRSGTQILRELQTMWKTETGRSGGVALRRDDAYVGRRGRSSVR